MPRVAAGWLIAVAVAGPVPTATAADDGKTAAAARAVLKQHCHRCHAGAGSEGGEFDVLDPATLTAPHEGDDRLVTPGKPAESFLLQRVLKNTMPPKAVKDRPTDADKAALKAWIEAGAPAFPADRRAYLSTAAVLTAVRDHLRAARPEDRPSLQFFTLANLHNNPRVPESDLRAARAALSKAVNSLHWKPRVVVPRPVAGTADAVLVVNSKDLDWDRASPRDGSVWREVQRAYPYHLRYDTAADDVLRDADGEVAQLAKLGDGDPLPLIRADWFVSTATRPPLYHVLADIPAHARDLEKRLNVDVAGNFTRDKLLRAGFAVSGVSRQNRLVERHDAAFGAYWKSYDFLPNRARADLSVFPLGPTFAGGAFNEQAFEHDGGEVIFSLPNRMQGYMLLNGKDERIDAGPIAVVGDSLKTSGTAEIVNGLSCMACHKAGMIRFKDNVRTGSGLFGEPRQKVQRLYPPSADLDERVKADADLFLAALDQAVGPFLKVGEDKDKSVEALTTDEPVAAVARAYHLADVDLAAAAFELDMPDPAAFKAVVASNKKLQALGLAALAGDGGRVKRAEWERTGGRSLFQRVAAEIGKGTPVVVR